MLESTRSLGKSRLGYLIAVAGLMASALPPTETLGSLPPTRSRGRDRTPGAARPAGSKLSRMASEGRVGLRLA